MTATVSATASAVAPDWLQVDSGAQVGPASYGTPAAPPAAPAVPVSPSPLPPPSPVGAPAAGGTLPDSEGEGAWPSLPGGGDGRAWLDRGAGLPQGTFETTVPNGDGAGFWSHAQDLQTYDALSQHTDTEGWDQNVANDRVSQRLSSGQSNPQNNPTWYASAENPALAHLAIGAVPFTEDVPVAGTAGFSAGALPDWAATGGQGNTAYEAPAPPPVTQAAASSVPDPAARWA